MADRLFPYPTPGDAPFKGYRDIDMSCGAIKSNCLVNANHTNIADSVPYKQPSSCST